jgi:hypothetical protein
MKFKSLILMTMVLVGFMCMPVIAKAYTLTFTGNNTTDQGYLYGYGPYQTGSGGEFTLAPDAGLSWLLNNYDSKALVVNGALQSFCLEEKEYAYAGSTNSVLLRNAAIKGGQSNSDPLSIGTAWLYYQFSKGVLANYNYDIDESSPAARLASQRARHESASALQNTIWWLEGELTNMPSNTFTTQVLAVFGNSGAAMADNNGSYHVMVATMWVPGHEGDIETKNLDGTLMYARQDMLATVPVPPAVYLLGAGLLGVVFIRKRISKV